MRLLTGVLVIAATLWGGYWFVGSSAVETQVRSMLDQATLRGFDLEYDALGTHGFPNRFDTTIEDIDLTHSATGINWKAPFFQVFALSYRPNHVIAVWPNTQSIQIDGLDIEITSENLRASVVVAPQSSLPLDRSQFEFDQLAITPDGAQSWGFEHGFLATRQTPAQPFAHDLSVEISEFLPPGWFIRILDPDKDLPAAITALGIDATIELTAPIDRNMTENNVTAVTFREAEIRWGELTLGVSGKLSADVSGYASGELTLTATKWREVFEVLVAARLVDPIWEGAIAPLALADGSPEDLSTLLLFERGMVYFGPLALGPAPRLN